MAQSEANIRHKYEYNKHTNFIIFDIKNEKREYIKKLPEQIINLLNKTDTHYMDLLFMNI